MASIPLQLAGRSDPRDRRWCQLLVEPAVSKWLVDVPFCCINQTNKLSALLRIEDCLPLLRLMALGRFINSIRASWHRLARDRPRALGDREYIGRRGQLAVGVKARGDARREPVQRNGLQNLIRGGRHVAPGMKLLRYPTGDSSSDGTFHV